MDRLAQLAKALGQLPRRLDAAVEATVRDNAHVLEDMNTAQLAAGLDADGQPIGPEYAPLTVAIKQLKGQPTDRVTLRDEGDFYAGVISQLTGQQSFELVGTDPKTDELQYKYGEAILGLTDAHVQEFTDDYVRPALEEEVRATLGL
ncbi:hypothetical protein LJ737_04265 [Hymenobacter sp. 15J16-1T3B]|uniref:hypothetical protein n=1 Tax=Hymenobacter sp. 15J16-1T3B TaxID=2886941 RepID=UPI001D12E243|nr:hypothetical protein [Hymenobacter sp. 15J16-1T3B]MCC3156437.1 hypothetical protein [Hymenobacter sp. 15J16-1T3B]